ncbi:unnamed protein product [Danaus chrysippus]|uniref:(African queen) hypothetical protein n=1 Tax=Danaus chrysippus TaxID=151541 RepID=A0A8J2QFW8_9NEOP|nr:unnamed protein product [Danaus chrysippus]
MALLLPQLLMIAIAEVLFAITGSEFIFKEAPETMKSVMTAAWLIIEAIGNIIIIVITRIFIDYSQETQTFIYAGLMCVSILIFHLISKSYQFLMSDEVKTEENSEQ